MELPDEPTVACDHEDPAPSVNNPTLVAHGRAPHSDESHQLTTKLSGKDLKNANFKLAVY